MAAVMMRAMGVGSSSSKGEKPAANGDEEGLSLSRQTSRLQPPYQAAGNPMGILINPLRPPSTPNSPPLISPYNNSSAASSLASVNLPRVLSGSDLANRSSYASSLASVPSSPTDDRGRSVSRDSATRGTTVSPRPGMPTTILSDTGLTKIESLENRKIRFAPLPEITGRDGEWDVAGLDDLGEELSRTQSAGLTYERGALDAMDDEDDEDERDTGRTGSMFGSWKSDTSFGGRRSADDEDRGSGSSSYTSKLLRPLSFGLVGKKKRSSSKGRTSSSADSLSRVSSNESDISRGSSMEGGGGFRPTGIPMRKTRTWESGDSGGPRESRRAQYPPVAQRSRTAKRPMSISAPDPTFNEWGAGASVGSVSSKSAQAVEDEDDGGGMAWIKKRRAQREAEKKAAEEEAQRKREEEQDAEINAEDEEGEGVDGDVPFALDDEDGEGDTTMEQNRSPSPAPTTGTERPHPSTNPSSSTTTPTISTSNTPKPQHSLLGMTRPSLNVVTATPEASPAIGSKPFEHSISAPSLTTAGATIDSPMSIGTPPRHHGDDEDSGHAQRLSDKLGKLAVGGRSTIHRAPVSPVEDSDEESDDDEEDDDEDNGDDSDLDEDELAQEEALAEEARRTLKSAGAERYHTKKHESQVVEVEGPRPSQPTRPAPHSRSSTIIPPSRQSTLVPERKASQ